MRQALRKTLALLASSGLGLAVAGCDDPPAESSQTGYRGTGMVQIADAERVAALLAANQIPPPPYELEPFPGEPLAGEAYENVQVLGHLPESQFLRLMDGITEWVSPDEGCGYCHNLENLASDEVYTKGISRRMLQMTWDINESWSEHVANVGVTCYTCHRGHPVPQNIWFENPGPPQARGMAGYRADQNVAADIAGSTSLPYDALSQYFLGDDEIRVHTATALPSGNTSTIMQTEWTYSLMIHMSESLGVNCTYCHNSRAFDDWNQGTPQRTTAWHGIDMVRELNRVHLQPLGPSYPDNRLGPLGDAPKVNCMTCHQGVNQPLYGASMLPDYPSLAEGPE